MRILLTGAEGFTGRHFSIAASKAGYEVFALKADLTNSEALSAEVKMVSPAYVLHLAAISAVTHADEEAFYRVNVFGTQNLLRALSKLDSLPEKVLLASSANVYGNSLESPITEKVYPSPVNHYAMSKLAMEWMSRAYFQGLPIVIARPFNYTGPGHDTRFVIPKIVEHFKRCAPEIELGNLDALREYNDVRMVCQVYLGLLKSGIAGEIYNVSSGNAISLQTVIATLESLSHHSIAIKVNPAFIRANEISVLSGSSKKIESLLGPIEHPSLEDTLAWMLNS